MRDIDGGTGFPAISIRLRAVKPEFLKKMEKKNKDRLSIKQRQTCRDPPKKEKEQSTQRTIKEGRE